MNYPNKKAFKKLITLKSIMFLSVIMYLIPKNIISLPSTGLDASWNLALNLAIKENLIWGKDIIFTFGPLGYLSTGNPVYVSKLLISLFYLFIVANGVFFIYYLFKSINKKSEIFFLIATLFFIGNILFFRDSIILYFYFTFLIFHFLKHKNILSLFAASLCCLFAFYIKVNTGLVLNILFGLFIIYNYLFKTINYFKITSLFIGHYIVLYFLSFPLNTDIFLYITNSFPIIDSYNDAMVKPLTNINFLTAALILLTVFVTLFLSFKSLLKSFYECFLIFNISLIIFVVFKQSFVRADHTILFFGLIGLIVILLYLFTEINKIRSNLYFIIVPIVILCIFSYGNSFGETINLNMGFRIFPQKEGMVHSQKSISRKLPEKILNEIGNKTIDVLGYEASYIYYNELKYNPRPIFQSYNAYNSKLININCAKYSSTSAPDYVLYHFGSIDNRHPYWDEPKIYLELFKNYTIFDTIPSTKYFNPLILFKKELGKRKIIEKIIMDTIVHFDSKIIIPKSNNLLYLTLDYDYTFLGKIRRIAFRPTLAAMDIYYDDNKASYFELIRPVMKSGVPINKKVLNMNEANTYFKTFGRKNINASYFILKGNKLYINDSFKMRIVEYKIED